MKQKHNKKEKKQKNEHLFLKIVHFLLRKEIFFLSLVLSFLIVHVSLILVELEQMPEEKRMPDASPLTNFAVVQVMLYVDTTAFHGNASAIMSGDNQTNYSAYINGMLVTNFGASLEGVKEMAFYNGTIPLVNFSYNFSERLFYFDRVFINSSGNKSSPFIIINMSGQVSNKTIYLDDNNLIYLCAEDAEISSIEEISSGCNQANEINFNSCLGSSTPVTIAGVVCIDEGSRIRLDGLQHSGVRGTSDSGSSASAANGDGGDNDDDSSYVSVYYPKISTTAAKKETKSAEKEKVFTGTYYPYKAKTDHFLRITAVYTGSEPSYNPQEIDGDAAEENGFAVIDKIDGIQSSLIYGLLDLQREGSIKKITLTMNIEKNTIQQSGEPLFYGYASSWKPLSAYSLSADESYVYYTVSEKDIKALVILFVPAEMADEAAIEESSVLEIPEAVFSYALGQRAKIVLSLAICFVSLLLLLFFLRQKVRKNQTHRKEKNK